MNQWIKLYIEALHDRKLRKLSRFDKSVFYDLLLLAGQDGKNGQLPEVEDIALELDLKVTEAKKSLEHLMQMGLVEVINDNLTVHNFKKRQESNLTGYEKVKRYRESHKEVINDNSNDNAMITEEGYQSVINDNPNDIEMITVDKEEDKDKEKDKEKINTLTNVSVYAPEKNSGGKSEKHKFGSRRNVLLTADEYTKLKARFVDADEKIENLSLGIASKGYKYKDHYATILNWARRDAEKQTAQPQKQPETTFGDIRNYFEAAETPQWDIDL